MRPRKTKIKDEEKEKNSVSVVEQASELTKWQRIFLNRTQLFYPLLGTQYSNRKNILPGHAKLLIAIIDDAIFLVKKSLADSGYHDMIAAKKAYEWLLHGSNCTYPFSLGWICEHLNSLGFEDINADTIAEATKGLAKDNGW